MKHAQSDYSKKTGRTKREDPPRITVGNDELFLSRYTTPDEENLDIVDEQPYTSMPRYVYWNDNGNSCSSISTKSNMSKEQVLEILKEATRN
ncbi:hypothetical protein ABER23_04510 [Paenibacillus lautus]|uniref:hypothetical protein n=1 Tax=Paenibacillus lautus TaxID=1401 RepID=UPI003D26E350